MSEAQKTIDHDIIRKWAEDRDGRPAQVASTGRVDDTGLLRIDFPEDEADDDLEEVSWDEFFDKFEEKALAFLYQEETGSGARSRFNKFVQR